MGLTWTLEIIAWIIIKTESSADVPEWFTYFLNMGNVLQGIVVFVIFSLKPMMMIVRKTIRRRPSLSATLTINDDNPNDQHDVLSMNLLPSRES